MLLALRQRCLGRSLLSHIHDRDDRSSHHALLFADRSDGVERGQRRPVLAPERLVNEAGTAAFGEGLEDRTLLDWVRGAVRSLVVGQFVHVAAEALLGGVPKEPAGGRVDEGAEAIGVHAEDAFRCRVQEDLFLPPSEVSLADGGLQFDLGGRGGCKVPEGRDVRFAPPPRFVVDGVEGAKDVTVGGGERDAGVGDDAQVRDRQVVADQRVIAGVLDDQRLARGDNVLAEGVGQGRLPPRGPWLAQPHGSLEDLAVRVHEGNQGHGNAKDARRQAREPVEGSVGRRVPERGPRQRGQPVRILDAIGEGGRHRASQFVPSSDRERRAIAVAWAAGGLTRVTISRHPAASPHPETSALLPRRMAAR